jgi:hypothetical protein
MNHGYRDGKTELSTLSLGEPLLWQRYGRIEDAAGIKESLHSLQASTVVTKGLSRLLVFVGSRHVGITSRQCVRRLCRLHWLSSVSWLAY